MNPCLSCGRGFHDECPDGTVNECCCESKDETIEDKEDNDESESNWRMEDSKTRRGKRDANLRDQQSTGRKRAAKLYPLKRNSPCEWRELENCGGGKVPITGCSNGFQQARHHGPDKNTLNNEPDNVHRICHTCHARWHVANDPDYIPSHVNAD